MNIDRMKHRWLATLFTLIFSCLTTSVHGGAVILGINLEFIDSRFNEEGFDGGFGIHGGYEFKQWHDWHFGGLVEFMNGWYNEDELMTAGEMMYESKSLYATARPANWPILFKAGVVDADYKVLVDETSRDFREVSDTGYAYGIALSLGNENFRIDLIDYKRITIGDDHFDSYGISLGVLFGVAGGFN